MIRFLCTACVFLVALSAFAGPTDSVVRLPSHGGSGTVIATGDGWTLVLSCAHCFEGRDRSKPVTIDMPFPTLDGGAQTGPGPISKIPRKVGVTVLAVGTTATCDVSLLRLNYGPAPYVSPVAPLGFKPGECWSIGFDEMRFPPQCKPARIVGNFGSGAWMTDTKPWHGRSGGALIDKKSGYVVGVVSAYTPTNGVYSSLSAIHKVLAKAGVIDSPKGGFPVDDCPDGNCPVPRQFGPQFSPQQQPGRR